MRIFRRPMFRKGGSTGQGIMTGLTDRKQYENGTPNPNIPNPNIPNPNIPNPSALESIDPINQLLISGGLNLLSGSTGQGTLADVATSFRQPTSNLFSQIADRKKLQSERTFKEKLLDKELSTREKIGMEKAQGEIGRKLTAFDAVTEVKRENVRNSKDLNEQEKKTKLLEIENKYNDDKEFFIIKGGDVSDFYKLATQADVVKAATRAAKKAIKADGIGTDDPTYFNKLATYQAQYLAIITRQFGKQFAEGGAVTEDINMMTATPAGITDVNVQETIEPKTQALSYDEIRARLPKEIGDDIVTLLANSNQALGDFAEIRTQADVDSFNTKYQVQLVLPQEA